METMLALDPGVTTGYCFGYKPSNEETLYVAPDEGRYTPYEIWELLLGFRDNSPSEYNIIYEDFQYRNYARAGLDLTPVKIIGVIECFIEMSLPGAHGTKQSPSTGKSFYSDAELKRLGVYKVGRKHGRDATRHLLQWANFGAGGKYFDHSNLEHAMVEVPELWEMIRRG